MSSIRAEHPQRPKRSPTKRLRRRLVETTTHQIPCPQFWTMGRGKGGSNLDPPRSPTFAPRSGATGGRGIPRRWAAGSAAGAPPPAPAGRAAAAGGGRGGPHCHMGPRPWALAGFGVGGGGFDIRVGGGGSDHPLGGRGHPPAQ